MMIKSVVVSSLFPDTVSCPDSLVRILRMAAEDNVYDTVEFYYEGDETYTPNIRSALDQFLERPVFLGGAYMKRNRLCLGSLDEQHRRHAVTMTKSLIDRAYAFGSRKMLVTSGDTLPTREAREASFELLAKSLIEICKYAEQTAKGNMLHITLEHFNDQGEPYYLIGPSLLARRLAEAVSKECSNFEVTYDLSHIIQLREQPPKSLAELEKHTKHIHLANCCLSNPEHPMFGDKHPPFGYPGSEVSWKDVLLFLEILSRKGFFHRTEEWTLGVEVITPEGMDALELYRETTRQFEEITNHILLMEGSGDCGD